MLQRSTFQNLFIVSNIYKEPNARIILTIPSPSLKDNSRAAGQ
jgi:hypothetical protein